MPDAKDAILLSGVCRHWRYLIHSQSTIWTTISISSAQFKLLNRALLQPLYQKVQPSDGSLSPLGNEPPVLSALPLHKLRSATFRVAGNAGPYVRAMDDVVEGERMKGKIHECSDSALEELTLASEEACTLCGQRWQNAIGSFSGYITQEDIPFFPNLRHLKLSSDSRNRDYCYPPSTSVLRFRISSVNVPEFRFPRLVQLTLDSIQMYGEAEMFKLLESCSSIESLCIRNVVYSHTYGDNRVTLTSLKTFSFLHGSTNHEDFGGFLEYINAPNLVQLEFQGDGMTWNGYRALDVSFFFFFQTVILLLYLTLTALISNSIVSPLNRSSFVFRRQAWLISSRPSYLVSYQVRGHFPRSDPCLCFTLNRTLPAGVANDL